MTNTEALQFAQEWIESFNRRDAAQVLSHFAENATFKSPKAAAFCGKTVFNSRDELAAYWTGALQAVNTLHFTLDHVLNDADARSLAIVYKAEINGARERAAEVYRFDAHSKVISGEALYGAPL